ncbi:unnamed protein product [Rhizoctonia solani]|uniref:Zn(2)-C6 fungal-type domain-containing protein n=1 Tax=Rhizoctonia solani TaxID=456999 RepID=A0A8H2W641_9AGAM|nr:unnamed protein product [Rhizoctonia solani]
MSRNEVSCKTCVARQKTCDGFQPLCRRCTRDRVACRGYPSPRNPIRGLSNTRTRFSSAFPRIDTIEPPVSLRNDCGPSGASNVSSSEPGTPSEWSNTGEIFASSFSESPPALPNLDLVGTPTHSFPLLPQAPPPPYHPTDIGAFNQVSRVFRPPKRDVRQSMTPGQASLFDALWSLALPEDDKVVLGSYSSFLDPEPPGPEPPRPSYNLPYVGNPVMGPHEKIGLEDSHDAQEVAIRLCRPLSLDKRVQSNSLPFVLESYSLWMRQFLFEPIRIIPAGREYILDEYYEGPEARWRMLMTSNATRAITRSSGYTLEDLEALQFHMHQGFPKAVASFGTDREADMVKARLAMSTTYEFIAIALKVFPLSMVVEAMQAVAPLFRRACPGPNDIPVNLPTLLSKINIGLEYYANLDIILGAIISRPMSFRYDTTFPPGIDESIFNIENGPGLRWTNGIPDRLVITLARMNALLEDFGSAVDRSVIKELELEIEGFKTFALASADPDLATARLIVQESWRQAAYIYLYMASLSPSSSLFTKSSKQGLCGADTRDERVVKVQNTFMDMLMRTKPGRIPDSFLVLPLPILGIATYHPDDQELLKRRMLALPECSRKNTPGNQFIRMLEFIWGSANETGQPATWPSLRMASLCIANV